MGLIDDMQGSKPASRPRYRVKGTFSPVSSSRDVVDQTCVSGTVNGLYFAGAGANGEVVQTWDMVTPNFSKRSRAGELITNPFRSLRESQTCSGEYYRIENNLTTSCSSPVKRMHYDYKGPLAGAFLFGGQMTAGNPLRLAKTFLISSSDTKNAMSVASTKAWSKSNAHSADILVDAAEFSKTIKLLRDPIQTTSTFLRKINSGKRGIGNLKVKDPLDYASSMWLQYRYGIRPLVASVQGVVKALDAIHSKRRSTSRGNFPNISTSTLFNGTHNDGQCSWTYTITRTDELLIRAGLVVEEDLSLSQSLGVDASGMLALPWELVPFSFVADWFANVNDFLSAVVPYLTKSPLSSWMTQKRITSTVFNVTSTSPGSGWNLIRPVYETRSGVFEEKIRTVGLELPSVAYKPQAISRVLNDARTIDAFTLLHQQFSKIFKP